MRFCDQACRFTIFRRVRKITKSFFQICPPSCPALCVSVSVGLPACLSVCPSVRLEQLGYHWTDFINFEI
jgi:hypothetical protein